MKTTVYIALAEYDYEGSMIIGVHSTKELAKACIDKSKADLKCHANDYEIEEYVVDE